MRRLLKALLTWAEDPDLVDSLREVLHLECRGYPEMEVCVKRDDPIGAMESDPIKRRRIQ